MRMLREKRLGTYPGNFRGSRAPRLDGISLPWLGKTNGRLDSKDAPRRIHMERASF